MIASAIRDVSTGVETQGRALRSSVRYLVGSAGVGEAARARIVRDIQLPPAQLLHWIARTLGSSVPLLDPRGVVVDPTAAPAPRAFAVVDRSRTRC